VQITDWGPGETGTDFLDKTHLLILSIKAKIIINSKPKNETATDRKKKTSRIFSGL
jgi:hypothetical protein